MLFLKQTLISVMTSLAHRIHEQLKALSALLAEYEPECRYVDLIREDLYAARQKFERMKEDQ